MALVIGYLDISCFCWNFSHNNGFDYSVVLTKTLDRLCYLTGVVLRIYKSDCY